MPIGKNLSAVALAALARHAQEVGNERGLMIFVRVLETGISVTALDLRSRQEECIVTNWSEISSPYGTEIRGSIIEAANALEAAMKSEARA